MNYDSVSQITIATKLTLNVLHEAQHCIKYKYILNWHEKHFISSHYFICHEDYIEREEDDDLIHLYMHNILGTHSLG